MSFFRGQKRDWPTLLPKYLRITPIERQEAEAELSDFMDWADAHPAMAAYRLHGNQEEWYRVGMLAIAQHYGIPTPLLDLTTSPEVAVLFAKPEEYESASDDAVIYCFSEDALRSIPGVTLIQGHIGNLWRLEAQRGAFLAYLNEGLSPLLQRAAIRIYFKAGPITVSERTFIYPERKSALETLLDQWFHRREMTRVATASKANNVDVVSMHRLTYPGAFRWRSIPNLNPQVWVSEVEQWVCPPVEALVSAVNSVGIVLPQVDFSSPQAAQGMLADVMREPLCRDAVAGKGVIEFSARLSDGRTQYSDSVSKILNRCWDGMRVLPYGAKELLTSMSLIATLVIARAEGVQGVDAWPQRLFGDTRIISATPLGGGTMAGIVSRKSLQRAFYKRYFRQLTSYMRRKANVDPEFLMLYIVDHYLLFEFSAFKKMFIEELIPTAVDNYWDQDLSIHKGTLESSWNIAFNPALLSCIKDMQNADRWISS